MSFLNRQDRTPKFAGQFLPDRTESGLIFLKFYLIIIGYLFSYDKVPGHKFGVKKSQLGYMWKYTKKQTKNWKQNNKKDVFLLFLKLLKVQHPGRKTSGFWKFVGLLDRTRCPADFWWVFSLTNYRADTFHPIVKWKILQIMLEFWAREDRS